MHGLNSPLNQHLWKVHTGRERGQLKEEHRKRHDAMKDKEGNTER